MIGLVCSGIAIFVGTIKVIVLVAAAVGHNGDSVLLIVLSVVGVFILILDLISAIITVRIADVCGSFRLYSDTLQLFIVKRAFKLTRLIDTIKQSPTAPMKI